MAFGKRRKKKEDTKLNLIPIMDAVFIFIFFLLMSAQFIDIYEVNTDAPIVSTITEDDPPKKDPLNLTVIINHDKLVLTKGVDNNVYKEFSNFNGEYDLKSLHQTLLKLKKEHPDEVSIIIRPQESVKYSKVVKVIDEVRIIKKDEPLIVFTNKDGKKVKTRQLFYNIIFETVSEG